MKETQTLFDNIPYHERTLRGASLLAEHAQEAIEDVLCDTSIFFQMPTIKDILRVKAESVYGVHKLVVTLKHGTSHPEYMLNARVVELEPKLVNVMFETGDVEDIHLPLQEASIQTKEQTPRAPQAQNIQTAEQTPSQSNRVKDISLLTLTCSRLDLSYPELAALIGYEAKDVIAALSRGDIEPPMRRAIELYLENIELKKELDLLRKI